MPPKNSEQSHNLAFNPVISNFKCEEFTPQALDPPMHFLSPTPFNPKSRVKALSVVDLEMRPSHTALLDGRLGSSSRQGMWVNGMKSCQILCLLLDILHMAGHIKRVPQNRADFCNLPYGLHGAKS